ncbi:putative membrane protein [Rubidibacter lacunae KORDI 51-2]|uniref:Putative membrane protein n=1 Tax=Rubidibacter lacunae KORDI 51-2 TaxID=582515 RepID=U5DRF3_9CHRO|nr:DUF805 domain-containing protein [Rubidibacter lacunae]ERN43189.1 putative membrane protein [Rubidibacter lacunae KORDI 51-2]
MEYYLTALRKYAVFSGRARRKEYWYFVLFNFLISFGLGIIDMVLGLAGEGSGFGVLGAIYALAVLVPGIAATVRRLHDTGRSGWWILIGFIPLVGTIVLIIFLVAGSESGQNQFDAA